MRGKRGEDPIRQSSIKHRDLIEIVINISSAGATSEAAATEAVEPEAIEGSPTGNRAEQPEARKGEAAEDNKIIIEGVYSFLRI